MFMVQPETCWLCDDATVLVPAMAFERDFRTVKQVRIPVHGAAMNLMVPITQPACTVGDTPTGTLGYPLHLAPKRVVGVQPIPGLGALRAATQGMRDRRSAAVEQAPTTPSRCGRREMRHCGP